MKPRPLYFSIILFLVLVVLIQACTKPLQSPAAPMASTVAATPTSTCAVTPQPSTGVPPMGIYWEDAGPGDILLCVNGAPEATCTVTVSGSDGSSAPMPYADSVTIYGTYVYSEYYSPAVTTKPGVTYRLTTVTSLGTAWASLAAPGYFSVAPDGSSIDWTQEADYECIYIHPPGNGPAWEPPTCTHPIPPISIPASAYSSGLGNYMVDECFSNVTHSITNGSGMYGIGRVASVTVTK